MSLVSNFYEVRFGQYDRVLRFLYKQANKGLCNHFCYATEANNVKSHIYLFTFKSVRNR